MLSKIKNAAALAALLITAWASLATSSSNSSLERGRFYIQSDCVTPAREEVIETFGNQIASPGGMAYTDFGFPNTVVKLNETNRGVLGAVTRECAHTYGDANGDEFIYSCSDNGNYVCSVLIRKY